MNLVSCYHFVQLYFIFPTLLGTSLYLLLSDNAMACKTECADCNSVVDKCQRVNPVFRNETQHKAPVENRKGNPFLISHKFNRPRAGVHIRDIRIQKPGWNSDKIYHPKSYAFHLLGLCVLIIFQLALLRGFGKFFVFKISNELKTISLIPDKRKHKFYMLILADWTHKYFIKSGYFMCSMECFALIIFYGQVHFMHIFSGVTIENLATSFQVAFQPEAQRWNRIDSLYDCFPDLVRCNASKIIARIIDNTTTELVTSPATAYCFIPTNKMLENCYLVLVLWTMMTTAYFMFRSIKNMIFFSVLTVMPCLRRFYITRILLTRFPFVGGFQNNYREKRELFRNIGPGQIYFLNEVKNQVGFETFKSFMNVYFSALLIDFLAQRAALDENMNERFDVE